MPRRKKSTCKKIFQPVLRTPAMFLKVHPFKEFWVDFATFSGLTKIAITSSKTDGFLIFQILSLGINWDNPLKHKNIILVTVWSV